MRETPDAPAASLVCARGVRTHPAWRLAAVAVLLVVAAAGLRTRGAFSRTANAAVAGATGAALATALVACEGVALVVFILLLVFTRAQGLPRDQEEPERLFFPWWAKTVGVLLALGLLLTPFVVLFSLRTGRHPPAPPLARLANPVDRAQPPNAAAPSSAWPLIAGMAIAIAVLLVLTLLTRRRRRSARPQDRVGRAAALAQGLAAGSAALRANHEPRAAIIACYAAMERGFAAAGSAPAAADTPAEVLARATAAGIVGPGPAGVLTGLFRRARYSAEPMTAADSGAAAAALAELHSTLTGDGTLTGPSALTGAGP